MHLCNFTFIIPHKNIPSLLQRCIDSIPQREDVHIVVVDDNSDSCQVDLAISRVLIILLWRLYLRKKDMEQVMLVM